MALSGNKENKSMRLIKYFSKAQEDAWRRETELVKELSDGDGHSNILKYCWHARGIEKCHLLLLFIVNRGEWLGIPANIKGANKDCWI